MSALHGDAVLRLLPDEPRPVHERVRQVACGDRVQRPAGDRVKTDARDAAIIAEADRVGRRCLQRTGTRFSTYQPTT